MNAETKKRCLRLLRVVGTNLTTLEAELYVQQTAMPEAAEARVALERLQSTLCAVQPKDHQP